MRKRGETVAELKSDAAEHRHHGAIAWMVRNPVAANLLMCLCLVGGLLVAGSVRQEVFPAFQMEFIRIAIAYPGAGPEEVESGVVVAVEESISDLDGVIALRSNAAEGMATVLAELDIDADADQMLSKIRDRIDRIRSFPEEAERAQIALVDSQLPDISLVLHGPLELLDLRELARASRQMLLDNEEIARVEVSGLKAREITIEVSRSELERLDLGLHEIAARVREASHDMPGGRLELPSGPVNLRTSELRHSGAEYCQINLLSGVDGGRVRLCDVADVRDGFAESDDEARFDGRPAVTLHIYRAGDYSPLAVSEVVQAHYTQLLSTLPEGVGASIWRDRSEMFRARMSLLLRNAYIGLALVLLLLSLFLEWRLAFWVTMGIPISFLGAILLMPSLDLTINMISLFAFIVTLGMVVDDAIVVGENIFAHQQRGVEAVSAAIRGAREVAVPVTYSILTTVVAFCPILAVPGFTGKLYRVIPTIVIAVLVLSLFESLFVLPAHLAHLKSKPESTGRIAKLRKAFTSGLQGFIERRYKPMVEAAVRERWLAISCGAVFLLVVVAYVTSGRMPMRYMPEVQGNRVVASVRLAAGAPLSDTRKVEAEMVAEARASLAALSDSGATGLRGILTEIGGSPRSGVGIVDIAPAQGAHVLSVAVSLVPEGERTFSVDDFVKLWRARVGRPVGVDSLEYSATAGPAPGADIDIELSHPSLDSLQLAAERVAEALRDTEGVYDINTGDVAGKAQITYRLRPEAASLGLSESELGRQLRAAFHGVEALRQQDGRDELRVHLRLPRSERASLDVLEGLDIRLSNGGSVPLAEVAEPAFDYGRANIVRHEGRRTLHVQAALQPGATSPARVIADVEAHTLARLRELDPELGHRVAGSSREQNVAMGAIWPGAKIALLGVFALLAIPFRSYIQPIIVMLAIPFGLAGAIGGHVLMGYELSIISLLGGVALGGVVVNDSLVLIHAANEYRRAGASPTDAIVQAGCRRFRPIVLTTVTTFCGLMPMILERSVQARFLVPMAISLAFGIVVATVAILLLVPAIYVVVARLQEMVSSSDA